jgi:hypothetical protein
MKSLRGAGGVFGDGICNHDTVTARSRANYGQASWQSCGVFPDTARMKFSFQRRTNLSGIFGDKKQMSKSSWQRQQMAEDLAAAEQQAGYERKDGALKKLVEHSAVADRIPEAFREGTLHRSHDFNVHGFGEAWSRGEEDPHAANSALERIAADLDQLIDRVHSDSGDEDVSGFDDPVVKSLVGDLRNEARLSSRYPAALVEGWAAYMLAHDPAAAEIIRGREQNPSAYESLVKQAGFALNRDAVSLENATRPSQKLPDGLTPADLGEMSEAEF